MRSTAPSVASTAPGNSVTDGDVINKRRLTADPVSKAEVPMWSSNDLSGLSLNFEYTVRQKLPPRGGNLERHQTRRSSSKMTRAMSHGSPKMAGFGATQNRLNAQIVTPQKMGSFLEPGQSDWGNGVIVGHRPDSLWGKRDAVPDDLDIPGHSKAAKPGELVGQKIYMEPSNPNKSALWSKTKEPRMAPLPKKHYGRHLQRTVDPYNTTEKEKPFAEKGTISRDRRIKSASFATQKTRINISNQTVFHTLHAASSSKDRIVRPATAAPLRGSVPSAAEIDRWNTDNLDLQREEKEDWDRRLVCFSQEERFNEIVGAQSFKATNKGLLSIAPNCTKYSPAPDPLRRTISETSAPFRRGRGNKCWPDDEEKAGTFSFISATERMKLPPTASVIGVGPQTYADGKLKDSITSRAQSARGSRGTGKSADEPRPSGGSRCQSARGAAEVRGGVGRYDGVVARPAVQHASRLVTDQMLERWASKLW